MANNVMEKLDRTMNFSYIIESLSDIAYNLNMESNKADNRSYLDSKDDLSYECENFLYDIKAYPSIKLENSILDKHEDLILNKFDKKEIKVENDTITFYEYKEDPNIIINIDPLTEKLQIRYAKNFINEKKDFILDEFTDNRQKEVTNYLMKENTLCEIDNLECILENTSIKYDNLGCILEDYAISFINKKYDTLKHGSDRIEIAYNEVISEGKIVPIVSCVDYLTEDILSMFAVQPKLDYNNKYKYELVEIFNSNK